MSPFGGLCSHPYRYMAAPAANVPALPACSSTSTLARNHCFHSPQPWLRFNPYLIPTSVTLRQNMPAARLPSSSNSLSELSKPGSRKSSPVSDNHNHKPKAKWRTASSKNIVNGSMNELQNIHNLVRGLDSPLPPL